MLKNTGVLIILSLFFLASCRKEASVVSKVTDNYSFQEQKTLGLALDKEYQESFDILAEADYPQTYQYLTTLLDMIVNTPSVSLRESLDWHMQIIHDDSQYKIFVSPTGSMYISTGLLRNLTAENQIVALMSHQVYYLESGAAFDLVKDKNNSIQIGKVILGERSDQIHQMANTLLFSAYAKKTVTEADEFEVNLLCPFKYNATGLIDVFHNQVTLPSLAQTTPWNNERATNIISLSMDCGKEDSLFVERYAAFKASYLPN